MNVLEAHEMSQTSALADYIWKNKHPEEEIDVNDREYVSWLKSTPHILEAIVEAGLSNLDVVFELPTPLGDYIDVALLGKSKNSNEDESGRLLIIELKQWSTIEQIDNKDYVKISVGNNKVDSRRHPVSQICEYELHLSKNHKGIYRNGKIVIDTLAYLHNFIDKESLVTEKYEFWNKLRDKIYVKDEKERLISYLKDTFSGSKNEDIIEIVDNCGYIMDAAGFSGLESAINGEENAKMVKDQIAVVDAVRAHIEKQKSNPHKEIIVVSGGPGTGKTIIGMHFIYDYADIFNNKKNADDGVFCLPKSKTVKAMIDYELKTEVVPYLDRIDKNQNIVVVDEAHRIENLKDTLNKVFAKGTKLLILLQDDNQRIRPGEEATFDRIKEYADNEGVEFTSLNLTIQKRCESLGRLLDGIESMFYGENNYDGKSIKSVKVFNELKEMDIWVKKLAATSRAKYVAPFCWDWSRDTKKKDVKIIDNGYIFNKAWNPLNANEQVNWYYNTNKSDEIASIYTCQGLDLDDVGFIWWDDLVWDDEKKCWKSNITKSRDGIFVKGVKESGLSQEEINELFINTYYVMLSRARNKMGIWFKDEATKKHVMEFLGLEYFDSGDIEFTEIDKTNTVIETEIIEKNITKVIGNKMNKSYHRPDCKYAPSNPEKRVEFDSVEEAINQGYKMCAECKLYKNRD